MNIRVACAKILFFTLLIMGPSLHAAKYLLRVRNGINNTDITKVEIKREYESETWLQTEWKMSDKSTLTYRGKWDNTIQGSQTYYVYATITPEGSEDPVRVYLASGVVLDKEKQVRFVPFSGIRIRNLIPNSVIQSLRIMQEENGGYKQAKTQWDPTSELAYGQAWDVLTLSKKLYIQAAVRDTVSNKVMYIQSDTMTRPTNQTNIQVRLVSKSKAYLDKDRTIALSEEEFEPTYQQKTLTFSPWLPLPDALNPVASLPSPITDTTKTDETSEELSAQRAYAKARTSYDYMAYIDTTDLSRDDAYTTGNEAIELMVEE